jgi:5'(3')-deoxyribonucleotidase
MRKLILVDMDGILVDFMGPWLAGYNNAWDDNLTLGQITSESIKKFVKPECGGRIYKIAQEPDFFDNLPPLPGAVEGFKALKKRGHEVLILTSPLNDHSARAKMAWCQRHLKIRPTEVNIIYRKYLVSGDVLIDDSPKKVFAWKEHNPHGITATIEYPYNKTIEDFVDIYASSYKDTEKAWEYLLSKIG